MVGRPLKSGITDVWVSVRFDDLVWLMIDDELLT